MSSYSNSRGLTELTGYRPVSEVAAAARLASESARSLAVHIWLRLWYVVVYHTVLYNILSYYII